MLSDKRINEIAGPMDYFDRRVFARAIEREATATLIEQIKEDEALMRKAENLLVKVHCLEFTDVDELTTTVRALRQRLEAKT